jgi:hypothetical protein
MVWLLTSSMSHPFLKVLLGTWRSNAWGMVEYLTRARWFACHSHRVNPLKSPFCFFSLLFGMFSYWPNIFCRWLYTMRCYINIEGRKHVSRSSGVQMHFWSNVHMLRLSKKKILKFQNIQGKYHMYISKFYVHTHDTGNISRYVLF